MRLSGPVDSRHVADSIDAGVKPTAEERRFSASGVNLNYFEHGATTAAPLVMLHGGAWRWQEYLSLNAA